MDAVVIERLASRLRANRADMLTLYGARGIQHRALAAICDVAEMWRDPLNRQRLIAERNPGEFPFEMVKVSLDALLDSLSYANLEALIARENLDIAKSPPLIGHVIAANTPLLAWTSVIRALLIGSASLVKLPSGPSSVWFGYFAATLLEVSPEIASLVDCASWKGGDTKLDRAFYGAVDKIVAYGSDQTLESIERVAAPTTVLGYGHRVSIAVVSKSADWQDAADGLATDILLYDQGGCLSPQTVFVEGVYSDAIRFGAVLADSLKNSRFVDLIPMSTKRTAKVVEARQMARFAEQSELWEDDRYRWTVIARADSRLHMSPTHAVITIVPVNRENIAEVLKNARGILQGAALATEDAETCEYLSVQLAQIGVSYFCRAGFLQCPPIQWRENGFDVLKSLMF